MILACLEDDYPGNWSSTRALSIIKRDGGVEAIPALADALAAKLVPIDRTRLRQRLAMLGAAMAPNRSGQDAGAWLEHMTRGLADLPEELLLTAIDDWVKVSKFPPSVAELREMVDPKVARLRRDASRLDAIARLIASGADVPAARAPIDEWKNPAPVEAVEPCTPEQAAEIMSEFGLSSAAKEMVRTALGPPRKPTREDYLALGVDPATLDDLMGEKKSSPDAGAGVGVPEG